MSLKNLGGEWDYYGAENPYFGVNTVEEFKRQNINEKSLEEFFLSGENYIKQIWKDVEGSLVSNFSPREALDFGCGVGRLVIPLAARCDSVTGVDISDGMLAEAKRNCEACGIRNAHFIKSNYLFETDRKFDLVHSFIVIQHIKPSIGENIFRHLVESVADGGVGVLQVMYGEPQSLKHRIALRAYRDIPFLHRLRVALSGKSREPYIPVYAYNLNKLFTILQENDCHRCLLKFTDHGLYGAIIYFRKQREVLF